MEEREKDKYGDEPLMERFYKFKVYTDTIEGTRILEETMNKTGFPRNVVLRAALRLLADHLGIERHDKGKLLVTKQESYKIRDLGNVIDGVGGIVVSKGR